MVRVDEVLAAARASVIAPAGCGKTELIVQAIEALDGKRVLALTHTHAGVNALRSRLRRRNVPSSRVAVDTIAGWCLGYARAYPGLARLPDPQPTKEGWQAVYRGMALLLKSHNIQKVISASYDHLLVDEYQDCHAAQHALISSLSNLLPTVICGDPLQAIFSFKEPSLDWHREIFPIFPCLGELKTPWRWKGKNEELGRWALSIRPALIAGQAIDLQAAPIDFIQATPENTRKAFGKLAKRTGSSIIITKWAKHAHGYARETGGAFQSMEEMDCNDLMSFADSFAECTPSRQAWRVLSLAASCFTGFSTIAGSLIARLDAERPIVPDRYTACPALAAVAHAYVESPSTKLLLDLVSAAGDIHGIRIYRRELWNEASRTIMEYAGGTHANLREAAWYARNRSRARGRWMETRAVSRTLLIKGLEFDHALVPQVADFNSPNSGEAAKNFYVAITRASHSLSLLAENPRIQFSRVT